MNIKYKCRLPRGVIQRWRFFSLAPFFNLNRLIKHHNILRNTNLNNRRNETNIDISLRVSNTNHLKLVRIYLPNPVCDRCRCRRQDPGYARENLRAHHAGGEAQGRGTRGESKGTANIGSWEEYDSGVTFIPWDIPGVMFFPWDTSGGTFFPWDTLGVMFFPWDVVGGCVNLRADYARLSSHG